MHGSVPHLSTGGAEPISEPGPWEDIYPANGSVAGSRRRETIESPLWVAKIAGFPAKLLTERNKRTRTVQHTIKFDPFIANYPGFAMGADPDFPAARYDHVSWTYSAGNISMSLNGFKTG